MPKSKKWFQKAVAKGVTTNLNGWSKSQSASVRRRRALASRPKNWNLDTRYLSAGRALQALANVTKDRLTKIRAKADADYFFRKARKLS